MVVAEVGSSPRQLALMETGANYDLMFSKKKMITHISLSVRSSRMFSKKKILFPLSLTDLSVRSSQMFFF